VSARVAAAVAKPEVIPFATHLSVEELGKEFVTFHSVSLST
jgi:hypothetical protein